MIFTYQLIKGYLSMLGNIMLHWTFGVATFLLIEPPKGLGASIDMELYDSYRLQLNVHFLSGLLWLLMTFIDSWKHAEIVTESSAIILIIFSFLVFI